MIEARRYIRIFLVVSLCLGSAGAGIVFRHAHDKQKAIRKIGIGMTPSGILAAVSGAIVFSALDDSDSYAKIGALGSSRIGRGDLISGLYLTVRPIKILHVIYL